jgi:hypothetical protein
MLRGGCLLERVPETSAATDKNGRGFPLPFLSVIVVSGEDPGSLPKILIPLPAHHPTRVEHSQKSYPDIGEDRFPQSSHARHAQGEKQSLDADGEEDVLPDDPPGAAGDAHRLGDPGRAILQKNHIRRLHGRGGAQAAHGHSHVRSGESGCIVETVTHKGYHRLVAVVSFADARAVTFSWGSSGAVFRETEFPPRHAGSLLPSPERSSVADAHVLQARTLRGVLPRHVRENQIAEVRPFEPRALPFRS